MLKQFRSVRKASTPGARILSQLLPARGVGWPGGWSDNRLEQVNHFRNWNYVSIHTICSKIGQLVPNMAYVHHQEIPGYTHKYGSYIKSYGGTTHVAYGGQITPSNGFMYRKALSGVKPHEDLTPIEHNHPLRRLLENPNPLDTMYDLMYELQLFIELCGVSYLWMVPNRLGKPAELWVLPAHWVWPRTSKGLGYWTPNMGDGGALIDYYEVRPWGGTGSAGMLTFPARDVLMFATKNPINKLDGWSAQSAGAMWIDTEESIVKSRWAQMCNQARADVHITVPGDINDPDDARLQRIEAKFMAKYQGELNYGKPMITPAGTTVTPLSFSPQEMAYFQSEEQARDMVLALRNVPKTAVGISNDMTFGSVLATMAGFCSVSINPRLIPLGQRLSKDLAPRFATEDNPIRVWYDDCSPADPQQVNSDISQDLQAYAITPNEVRAIRGRPAYKHGGDDPMVNGAGGVVPLPLNTGEDLTGLGELVPTYPKDQPGDDQGGGALGGDMPGGGDGPGYDGDPDDAPAPAGGGSDALDMSPIIAAPNGNPSKAWRGSVTKGIGPHKFTSTQIDLNQFPKVAAVLRMMQARIDPADLVDEGLETDLHVTTLYGLKTTDAEEVRRLLADFGPVTLELGRVTVFEADDGTAQRGGKEFDVVKVDIGGQDVRRLNALLRSLPHKSTFPDYVPHATLAYVRPGAGMKYASPPDATGSWAKVVARSLTFSDPEGFRVSLSLAKPEALPAKQTLSKAAGFVWFNGEKVDPVERRSEILSYLSDKKRGIERRIQEVSGFTGDDAAFQIWWRRLPGNSDDGYMTRENRLRQLRGDLQDLLRSELAQAAGLKSWDTMTDGGVREKLPAPCAGQPIDKCGGEGGTPGPCPQNKPDEAATDVRPHRQEAPASSRPAKVVLPDGVMEDIAENGLRGPLGGIRHKVLEAAGASAVGIKEMDALFDQHRWGEDHQAIADKKIKDALHTDTDLGRALRIQVAIEDALLDQHLATRDALREREKQKSMDDMKDLWDMRAGNTDAYDSWQDQWEREEEYKFRPKPLLFYRKGGMDKDVLPTSTSSRGAQSATVGGSTAAQPHYEPNNQWTADELRDAGYHVLGGIGYIQMGYPGENEVTWIKWGDGEARKKYKALRPVRKSVAPVEVDKGMIGDTVQSAGRWLAAKWESLEARYGRKAALAMAVAGLVTLPIPGNITAIIGIAEGIRGVSGYFRRELGSTLSKAFSHQVKGKDVELGDEKERINNIADILYHVYGEDAIKFFDEAGDDDDEAGAKTKAWSEAQHPRGANGRFITAGSGEAASAAKENVATALKKPKTPESHKELAEHLNLLTVKQLAEIKKEYQISASGRNKKELVAKLADRLSKGRTGGEKPEGESPSYADWASGERASRKPKPDAAEGDKPDQGKPDAADDKPADDKPEVTAEKPEAAEDKPSPQERIEALDLPKTDEKKPTAKELAIERKKVDARKAATVEKVNKRIDRMESLMNKKGQHEAAGWMRKLKDHINAVGPDAALSALGDDYGSGDAKDTIYEGKAEDMSWFCENYLKRNGIIPIASAAEADPSTRLVSSQSPTFGEQARPDPYLAGDFSPVDPTFKDKLQEAKHLPGLESSEDISKIVGKDVTHLSSDVTAKMDEKYGKGKWIIKTYGDDAYAGFGIYFPQRIEKIKQDAQNVIWTAGENLGKYGFRLGRDGNTGKVFGLVHESGDTYQFGTEEYDKTINGDAKEWAERARGAAENENGPALFNRDGKVSGKDFMAQPAFEAIGISDAERARGVTGAEGGKGEGRTHIITRNGKAELIPHSTWIKGESLPVVFEDENTKAMAQAALDAINALPESERQGQIYAPDIMPSAEGFRVVEANPANETGSSGYLGDNPFIIDSYVSSLTGRSPAHVRFIRKLLQEKGIDAN